MFRLLLASFFFSSLTATAQIPANYYNNAYTGGTPKTCANLKTSLFNIISSGTTVLPYNATVGFDTWDAVNRIDVRRNDANTATIIWDMYTDNPTGSELYSFTPVADQCGSYGTIGDCYNREHSFPQVWFGSVTPMLTDMHHIFGSDGFTNGKHDNYPYGEVKTTSIDWSSPAGAKLGACSFPGYTGKVFEPINEYKGDFARAMFYMVTRYESDMGGGMSGWQGNGAGSANAVLDGTTWPSLDAWAIKQWYKWHLQDPVSQKEIDRNDSIYRFQGNRNPFIDHPEFVQLIWQCTNLLPVTLTDFTAIKNSNTVVLQWNISSEINFSKYEVERSVDGITFAKVGTVTAQQLSSYTLTDKYLPDAKTVFYRLRLVDIDGQYSYSKTVSIRLNPKAGGISIYPNPAVNELSVVFQQVAQSNAVLKITDVAGKEVLKQTLSNTQHTIRLKVNQLPAGRYFVTVISNGNLQQDSFVIVK